MTNTTENIALSGKPRKAIGNYDWEQAKVWYEETELTITGIARKIGCTRQALNLQSKKGGWHRQFVGKGKDNGKGQQIQGDNNGEKKELWPGWDGRQKTRESDQATFIRRGIDYLVADNPDQILFRRYCHSFGIFRADVKKWGEDSKLIAALIAQALEAEEVKLLQMGLTGKTETQPTRIYWDYKFGIREKKDDKSSAVVLIEIGGGMKELTY